MTSMTGIDLDFAGIRARAVAATPGPWRVIAHKGYTDDSIVTDHPHYQTKPHGNHVADTGYSAGHQRQNFMNDSAHIAGMDPPTVIAMCDLIERQAGEIARLREALVPFAAHAMPKRGPEYDGILHRILVPHAELRLAAEALRALTPKEDTPCRTA